MVFESQFSTRASLTSQTTYLTNKLARNHRRGGGAESSRLTELSTQKRAPKRGVVTLFSKALREVRTNDCGVVYCTVQYCSCDKQINRLAKLVVDHEAGNLENTTTKARARWVTEEMSSKT